MNLQDERDWYEDECKPVHDQMRKERGVPINQIDKDSTYIEEQEDEQRTVNL